MILFALNGEKKKINYEETFLSVFQGSFANTTSPHIIKLVRFQLLSLHSLTLKFQFITAAYRALNVITYSQDIMRVQFIARLLLCSKSYITI